ncbi:hypothetical protein Pmani_013405 [Petrolisthes manimaculis]|uniref:Uncharacterized protein n=1 Tax=Petrolisthes manimaculis TaxID=1843537 RepID=A0AAE1PXK2_9EUCA|nr:hypothetical protein Pmani_013405 [Petrolisthes manimaculis]
MVGNCGTQANDRARSEETGGNGPGRMVVTSRVIALAWMEKALDEHRQRSKQLHSLHRREEKKTGGGAPPPDIPKDVEKVLSLILPEVNDLGCNYDDDALPALANSYRTYLQESITVDDPEPVNQSEGLATATPGPSKVPQEKDAGSRGLSMMTMTMQVKKA